MVLLREENGYILYRSPSEIRRDMHSIAEQIQMANARMNIRDLVVEAVYTSGGSTEELIQRLCLLCREAEEARAGLERLQGKLLLLQGELEEVRRISCQKSKS